MIFKSITNKVQLHYNTNCRTDCWFVIQKVPTSALARCRIENANLWLCACRYM